MATTKVTMVSTTRHNGQAYLAGTEYDVEKADAERWVDLGIAVEGTARRKAGVRTAHEEARHQVMLNELEVASQHGDVNAARRLDALRAGTAEPDVHETTGESARQALGR